MEFKTFTDTVALPNGLGMPCIGYGTWKSPDEAQTRDAVKAALRLGYRHVDTATAYGNEDVVGEGIRTSGVPRDEIFVTTKHWVTERGYEKTIAACEASLRKMGLDHIELYLIHWPCVNAIDPAWQDINADTWRGFEKLYQDGKVRAIGVSNFMPMHLASLEDRCTIRPMVNQIEIHPGYPQREVVDYCRYKNIAVEAWSPLGSGAVLKDEFLSKMAEKYGKSVAQLCIRFALERGAVPLVKSLNEKNIAANLDVFDFEIAPEDMQALLDMPRTGYSGFYPEEAPADR